METFLEFLGILVASAAVLALVIAAVLFYYRKRLEGRLFDVLTRVAATGAAGVYALSPIDLIPDFIPVLGQLDDIGVLVMLLYFWYSLLQDPEAAARKRPPSERVIDIKPVD